MGWSVRNIHGLTRASSALTIIRREFISFRPFYFQLYLRISWTYFNNVGLVFFFLVLYPNNFTTLIDALLGMWQLSVVRIRRGHQVYQQVCAYPAIQCH